MGTDEWTKKMYIYTEEYYYSTTKNNKIRLLQENGCNWRSCENTRDPKVCMSPNYLSYLKSGMQRDHENRKVAIWEKDWKGLVLGRE